MEYPGCAADIILATNPSEAYPAGFAVRICDKPCKETFILGFAIEVIELNAISFFW